MRLREAVQQIQELPRKHVIYVPRHSVSVDPDTEVLLVAGGDSAPEGWKYMLELWIAQEVLEVWSAWRDGRSPTLQEACDAVIYYADYDAYLPEE